ncbi:ABC transporter ATP-binding protein [Halopseudomonas salegens]|uniref:ABC-2 type transport system ATP-binding protein n=1 Tax=Halopseudomonas salegens TaxID=1434072 RepID=A0A1H2GUE9_9GAMM|nr:ABC transporter ATP-binding protein [Halopseudomonas salegens]SDU23142.1 ABC-2 type transport system ATP-binding protein [Halopseudomonas salegens]
MTLLDIDQLTFGYRQQPALLADISLRLADGDMLGLLGPNGAGKTTLVSLITGLLKPGHGSITLNGKQVALGDRRIALVPQEYAFYPRLSGRENLTFFAGVQGLKGNTAKQAVDRVLAQCALTDTQHQRAARYSGGLKRRLNFAIAILTHPQLLILDEPTANVDPQTRKLLLDIVRELHQEGVGIIYTSHLLGEVENLCNQVALLHGGRLVLHGSMDELLRDAQQSVSLKPTQTPSAELVSRFNACQQADHWWRFELPAGTTVAGLLSTLEQAGLHYTHIRYGTQALEDIYLALTSDTHPASAAS